jgi:cell division protein FtsB
MPEECKLVSIKEYKQLVNERAQLAQACDELTAVVEPLTQTAKLLEQQNIEMQDLINQITRRQVH